MLACIWACCNILRKSAHFLYIHTYIMGIVHECIYSRLKQLEDLKLACMVQYRLIHQRVF